MVLALQVELSESGVGDKGTLDRCRSFVSDVVLCGFSQVGLLVLISWWIPIMTRIVQVLFVARAFEILCIPLGPSSIPARV